MSCDTSEEPLFQLKPVYSTALRFLYCVIYVHILILLVTLKFNTRIRQVNYSNRCKRKFVLAVFSFSLTSSIHFLWPFILGGAVVSEKVAGSIPQLIWYC